MKKKIKTKTTPVPSKGLSVEAQRVSAEPEMISPYIPTEEMDNANTTDVGAVSPKPTPLAQPSIIDVTENVTPEQPEPEPAPQTEERGDAALHIYPSAEIEIKHDNVVFLKGLIVVSSEMKIQRKEPQLYILTDAHGELYYYECTSLEEADNLWAELQSYVSGKEIKIASTEHTGAVKDNLLHEVAAFESSLRELPLIRNNIRFLSVSELEQNIKNHFKGSFVAEIKSEGGYYLMVSDKMIGQEVRCPQNENEFLPVK